MDDDIFTTVASIMLVVVNLAIIVIFWRPTKPRPVVSKTYLHKSQNTFDACSHIWDTEEMGPVYRLKVTEEMWERLQKIYPDTNKNGDYLKQVWYTFAEYLTHEERYRLDMKILAHDYNDLHIRVLLGDYRGYIHLNKLRSHVEAILRVYDHPEVKKHCLKNGLTRNMLEVHDFSKTCVLEIVSYTYKLVHKRCGSGDYEYQVGVQHHFGEKHHPQYWIGRRNCGNMPTWCLMESILDLAGCRFQNDLESVPNALLSDVFDIPSKFLGRYTDEDRRMVEHHLTVLRNVFPDTLDCGETRARISDDPCGWP